MRPLPIIGGFIVCAAVLVGASASAGQPDLPFPLDRQPKASLQCAGLESTQIYSRSKTVTADQVATDVLTAGTSMSAAQLQARVRRYVDTHGGHQYTMLDSSGRRTARVSATVAGGSWSVIVDRCAS